MGNGTRYEIDGKKGGLSSFIQEEGDVHFLKEANLKEGPQK